MSNSPGVLLLCDFVQSSAAKGGGFAGFIEYQDRPEAFEVVKSFDGEKWSLQESSKTPGTSNDLEFGGYLDYQDREKAKPGIGIQNASQDPLSVTRVINNYYRSDDKSDGLFDAKNDRITVQDKEWYRSAYQLAQSNGCPLYRGVLSFDNDFLKAQGLMFDTEIDKRKLKDITRAAVSKIVDKSHLNANECVWTAAIHYNTDNVHVHFSLVEEHKHNRRKDMLSLESIDAAKSKVVNMIVGSDQAIIRTKLLREELLPDIKNTYVDNGSVLIDLMQKLPDETRWEYNRRSFVNYTGFVDQAVDQLIKADPEALAAFTRYSDLLQENALQLRQFYGDGNRHLWEDFVPDRMRDFYSRAGNDLLQELQTSHEIDLDALDASGKYTLDQMAAIRSGLSGGADVSAIIDNEITGANCWTYLRLQKAGCPDNLIESIMQRDLHTQDLAAWVCEAGADPAQLLQHEYSPDQATVIAIALRHQLDPTTISDPNLPAADVTAAFNKLAASTAANTDAAALKDFDFDSLTIDPEKFFKTPSSAVASDVKKNGTAGKARDATANHSAENQKSAGVTPSGATGKAGENKYAREDNRRFAPHSASPARCRSAKNEYDKVRQSHGQGRNVGTAALVSSCRSSSRRLQRDYSKRLQRLEREYEQQNRQEQRSKSL